MATGWPCRSFHRRVIVSVCNDWGIATLPRLASNTPYSLLLIFSQPSEFWDTWPQFLTVSLLWHPTQAPPNLICIESEAEKANPRPLHCTLPQTSWLGCHTKLVLPGASSRTALGQVCGSGNFKQPGYYLPYSCRKDELHRSLGRCPHLPLSPASCLEGL